LETLCLLELEILVDIWSIEIGGRFVVMLECCPHGVAEPLSHFGIVTYLIHERETILPLQFFL
jgi:hypothetical protein